METITLRVPSISCEHCVKAIRRTLHDEVPGVGDVRGDPAARQVTIAYGPPATLEQIVAAMTELGYPPER